MKQNRQQPRKQTAYKKASAQGNARRRKRRRRGKNILYYLMFAAVSVSIGILLSLTVFFKIETIEVQGGSKYQSSAILKAVGVEKGDNLFRVNDKEVAEAILKTYPYVEAVKVRRSLPSKLTLQLTDAVPVGTFLQPDGSYVIVSTTGRILELGSGTPPAGILQVSGVEITDVAPCETLPEENNESLVMLTYLVNAVQNTGFTDITEINLSDELNMYIVYDDRVKIVLGSESNLVYKLDFAKYALDNNVRPDFEGIMDVTMEKRISILPQEIHPDGYHGEPEPELPEQEETEQTDEQPGSTSTQPEEQ